jgi:hypothetical protein
LKFEVRIQSKSIKGAPSLKAEAEKFAVRPGQGKKSFREVSTPPKLITDH